MAPTQSRIEPQRPVLGLVEITSVSRVGRSGWPFMFLVWIPQMLVDQITQDAWDPGGQGRTHGLAGAGRYVEE